MILVDYSQTIIASIFANKIQKEISEELVRHIALNTIRSYAKLYGNTYGSLIICVDGKNTWRKKEFSYYKANRKKGRDEDKTLDWNLVYEIMNTIREELKTVLPYPVIQMEGAEGDDVIAVLTKKCARDNEKVLIISSDKDFAQLQQYDGVAQFSPLKNDFIRVDEPKQTLFEHIIKGDSGDGVPNIFSDDDTFVIDGKRQTPCTKKKLDVWMSYLFSNKVIDRKIINEESKRNFNRNQMLIDLVGGFIPSYIEEEVHAQLDQEMVRIQTTFSGSTMIEYLMSRKLRTLIECIDEFLIGQTQILTTTNNN